jgi:hypothetical protein
MHCRFFKLERQLASSQVPKEQQSDLIKKYGEKVHTKKQFFKKRCGFLECLGSGTREEVFLKQQQIFFPECLDKHSGKRIF